MLFASLLVEHYELESLTLKEFRMEMLSVEMPYKAGRVVKARAAERTVVQFLSFEKGCGDIKRSAFPDNLFRVGFRHPWCAISPA